MSDIRIVTTSYLFSFVWNTFILSLYPTVVTIIDGEVCFNQVKPKVGPVTESNLLICVFLLWN